MPNYIRADFPGGYYFFTVVTFNRRNLFEHSIARDCLHRAMEAIRSRRPFEMIASCLLPNHLHCIWKLPDGDAEFSKRWASIKAIFTREYIKHRGIEGPRNSSRTRSGEAAIWQRRFWEHQIRDQKDLQNHVNYIHYNPVKHGLVENVEEWPWSSIHRYIKDGYYGKIIQQQNVRPPDDMNVMGE